jgi:hypothetical protein
LWVVGKSVRIMPPSQISLLTAHMRSAKGEEGLGYYYRERSLVQPLGSRVIYSSPEVKSLSSRFYHNKKPDSIDHFFLCIMSIIIFFMQCGFAFMEAGAVK